MSLLELLNCFLTQQNACGYFNVQMTLLSCTPIMTPPKTSSCAVLGLASKGSRSSQQRLLNFSMPALRSPGGHIKTLIAGSQPQFLTYQLLVGWGPRICLANKCSVMSMLLVWESNIIKEPLHRAPSSSSGQPRGAQSNLSSLYSALLYHRHTHLFTYCLWQFSWYSCRVVQLGQTLYPTKPFFLVLFGIFTVGEFGLLKEKFAHL